MCGCEGALIQRGQVWGRIWPQVSSMLVKAKVTGRNMQVEGTANSSSHVWALLTHDIAKILADVKDLQKSSCEQFSLLLLVYASLCSLWDLCVERKGWDVTFGQDVADVEISQCVQLLTWMP